MDYRCLTRYNNVPLDNNVSFFYVGFFDFSLNAYSSCRSGPKLEERIRAFFNLLAESCLPGPLLEEDLSKHLAVNRSSIPARMITHLLLLAFFSLALFLFVCSFFFCWRDITHCPLSVSFGQRQQNLSRISQQYLFLQDYLHFASLLFAESLINTSKQRWLWFFYFLSRLLSNTELNYSKHLRFGWLHCPFLHLVTFHFAFLSRHLNFITNLGMYLGHLPLTHQNCWLHQPACECNALVQFCRTESCFLPNYWSLKSRVSLARNSSQLHRQHWCVALADWPIRAARSEKW